MLKIVSLSRYNDEKGLTIEATFQDGEDELIPLKVNQKDKPEIYSKVTSLLEEPNTRIEEAAYELYDLMAPVARVKRGIDSSFYLSDNLVTQGGSVYFGKHLLENTLASHLLSLLDDDNTPINESLWKSYIKFLDNLHQNVDENIRKQLFRWMDYENKAGNGFGITDDGCIVGYKGCEGTILEPVSIFTGRAIVDGVEVEGQIPNRVGSVISMPRSAVQFDPKVGCAQGLHVGTRDYAVQWAPILLLVKVNPRDVVSVPYECESQKMRVCEYTVLKITDVLDEHKMYHPDETEEDWDNEENWDTDSGWEMTEHEAERSLYNHIYVEYDCAEKAFEGVVVDVYKGEIPGIIVKNKDDEYKHIKLNRISFWKIYIPIKAEEKEEAPEDDLNVVKKESTYESLYDITQGSFVVAIYREQGLQKTVSGFLLKVDKENEELILRDDKLNNTTVKFENLVSVQSLSFESD